MRDTLEALLTTLGERAETLVRRPRSTVEPPRDVEEGARALAQLRALAGHEPYTDEGLLGRGGMGVVRLSTQHSLNRKVAVKSLRPDRAGEAEVEALVAEAWRTGRLEHPNILPVYGLRLLPDGQPELVMKRIEGRSWSEALRAAPVFVEAGLHREALARHLLVLGQVCHALHFAHARGLVHRDVKPDNVMLGAFGEVYLVDWGIATAPGPAHSLAGTPAYAAPEMLGGDGVLSPATDVYLLGAVLFEVLTGQPPHLRATPSEVLDSILRSEPQLPDTVPRELTDLVRSCMQADATKRPTSAEAVRVALEGFAAHQGSELLTTEAATRLRSLETACHAAAPDIETVASAFAACRFGFQQALREWPGNDAARTGLATAIELMVRFELARGSARAAQVHLAELGTTNDALTAEVARAVAEEQARKTRLQSLELAMDPRTGSTPRFLAAAALALVWVVMPMMGTFTVRRVPHLEGVLSVPLALFSGLTLLALRTRFRASLTPLNRQLSAMLVFAWLVQAAGLLVWFLTTGTGGFNSGPLLMSYWAFVTGLITVSMLKQAWPIPLAYVAALVMVLQFPDTRFLWQALTNLTVVVTLLVLWRRNRR